MAKLLSDYDYNTLILCIMLNIKAEGYVYSRFKFKS